MLHVHKYSDIKMFESLIVWCFLTCIAVASGSWHESKEWGLSYPESSRFLCPGNLPITSIYSEFNENTSLREWKFNCQWSGIHNISVGQWSGDVNEPQKDFVYDCPSNGAYFISAVDVTYYPQLADGQWRFGCNMFTTNYRPVNCTVIPVTSNVGKLQQVFEYTSADSTTFVTGISSNYDIGLKDRIWGIKHCKLGIVRCSKPPQPEGVLATYNSLEFGSRIAYKCKVGYSYMPEKTGVCSESGQWTVSPPDTCKPCAPIPYCADVLCTFPKLNNSFCAECQNFTDNGLPLEVTTDYSRCEAKPVIINPPPAVIDFDVFDEVILNCNASGYPKPAVMWFHNSTIVQANSRVLVLSNGSLVLREAVASDVGIYVCVASSDSDIVAINVTLKLKAPESPVIVNWTNTLYFPLKQYAILHCITLGYPEPHIIWSKDGVELQHKGRIQILRNGTLLIRKAKKSDSGRYRCQARNRVGWIAREAYVHVYRVIEDVVDTSQPFPPVIKPWKLLVIAELHSQVVLPCNASGNPQPTTKWLKLGDKPIREGSRKIFLTDGSLIIRNVQEKDRGEYTCRAVNSLGTTEKHVLLIVKSITVTQKPPTPESTATSFTNSATHTTPDPSPTTSSITSSSVPMTSSLSSASNASTLKGPLLYWLSIILCTSILISSLLSLV